MIRVVGKDSDELDNTHGRERVYQYVVVWSRLVNAIKRDTTLLYMVIATESPSEAWKILSSMVSHESSEASEDKLKKELEELTLRLGEASVKDCVVRAKDLVMKLEQHSVNVSERNISRRVLNDLLSAYSIKKRTFVMMALCYV